MCSYLPAVVDASQTAESLLAGTPAGPLVIRLMIGMALMPDASYCEALTRLAGLLADIPFALQWHVPTEKVVTA
jgi:hypothetical protein